MHCSVRRKAFLFWATYFPSLVIFTLLTDGILSKKLPQMILSLKKLKRNLKHIKRKIFLFLLLMESAVTRITKLSGKFAKNFLMSMYYILISLIIFYCIQMVRK